MNNKNTTEIIDAYKSNLSKVKNVKELQLKIRALFDKMQGTDIPNIIKLYGLVFKNINPDKKYVCDVDNCNTDDYAYNEDDSASSLKRKLFLNRDGLSFSNAFNPTEAREVDISRTIYLTSFNQKGFIKMLIRLYNNRTQVIDAIPRDYKKSIVIRFFEAFEQAECHKIFDYDADYDYLKINLPENIPVKFYNDLKIESVDVNFISLKNASHQISVSKGSGWNSRNSIDLNDLEKVSQIYEELMEFLNKYYEHLDVRDKSLSKFYNMLKDSFAKELILDSLKETKGEQK